MMMTEIENQKEIKAVTYNIPKGNFLYLKEKLAKLNKKADKLGVEPITFKIIREFSTPEQVDHAGKVLVPQKWYFEIEIINSKPVHLPGWELVAVITPVGDEKLLKVVPDKTVPTIYRNASMVCEHCNKARYRKDTFVMHHTETGEYKQIGRQCIQDFLGGDPTRIFNRASWVRSIEDALNEVEDDMYMGPHGGHDRCWGLEETMYLACAVIRKTGYWSKKAVADMEGKSSTHSDVMWLLRPSYVDKDQQYKDAYIEKWGIKIEDQDIEFANKIIEWAKQIPTDTNSDYFFNLGVAARSGVATYETSALLISSIEAYKREVLRIEYEKKEKKESNWVGQPKERITIKGVKQIHRYAMEGDYGIRSFIKFLQEETGNIFIWWASGDVDYASEKPINIMATVKAHEEYKGTRQTVILRVKEVKCA